MNHFRPIEHIDTFDLVASLREYMQWFDQVTLRQTYQGSAHKDTRTIYLRGPENPTVQNWFDDVEHIDYQLLEGWPEAVGVLTNDIFRPPRCPGPLAKAMIVELAPGGVVQWHRDEGPYADKHHRFHLPLVTNPNCLLISGNEHLHVPVGQLTWFDNHVMHSAVNFGKTPRYHLIVDYRIAA